MEDYTEGIPANEYFSGAYFNLTPGAERYKETILDLSFYLAALDFNFGVYSNVKQGYQEAFSGEAKDVDGFIENLEATYGVVIPSEFAEQMKTFLTLKDQAFSVFTDMSDTPQDEYESRSCEQCGDMNENEFSAYYFPAIDDLRPASLSVKYDYGCYGGDTRSGIYSEVKDEAILYITGILHSPDPGAKALIVDFLKKLKQLQD